MRLMVVQVRFRILDKMGGCIASIHICLHNALFCILNSKEVEYPDEITWDEMCPDSESFFLPIALH